MKTQCHICGLTYPQNASEDGSWIDAHIAGHEAKSLLDAVNAQDKPAIKDWEDRAETGEIMRIM